MSSEINSLSVSLNVLTLLLLKRATPLKF